MRGRENLIQRMCDEHNQKYPKNGILTVRKDKCSYSIILGAKLILSNLTDRETFCAVAAIKNYAEAEDLQKLDTFTDEDNQILDLLADYRNYNSLKAELSDNAVGVYIEDDVLAYTKLSKDVAMTAIEHLLQKDMLYKDKVNGKCFYRATNKCIRYLYKNYSD